MRGRVEAERARWVKQLDEATEWMVDNMDILVSLADGLPTGPESLPTDRKAELLVELTTPVWEVFGSCGWR
ncbi:hypothetical protein ACWD04_29890 [Streptomyces sp. NPDC002911]